ncbi:MAG TPA: hypothetical protein VKO43_00240 [Candidatus Krumholzibacteriaceae bacterium]|nr:hypothetical protein [Candidatus Krumholzibacteriaceae bacterium]
MFSDFSEGEITRRAKELIMHVHGVKSCRISTGDNDEIAEIHIVAATDRPPKLLARDAAESLSAELDIDIDPEKIGVVIIDSFTEEEDEYDQWGNEPEDGLSDEGEEFMIDETGEGGISEEIGAAGFDSADSSLAEKSGELELLEEDVRIRFKGINLQLNESKVKIEVLLEKSGLSVSGYFEEVRGDGTFHRVAAEAALDGVIKLVDEDFNLCLSDVEQIKISGREAIVASVKVVENRRVTYLSGTAFVEGDGNEASVYAVLDAVNRPFGRWKSKRQIHYRIR